MIPLAIERAAHAAESGWYRVIIYFTSLTANAVRGVDRFKRLFETISNENRFAGFPFEKTCTALRA